MFKKKPKKQKMQKLNSISNVLDVKNKIREFFMDTQSPDADKMAMLIGCTPISDDVLEREEEESDKRIERVAYLLPLIRSYAKLFAEAYISVTLSDSDSIPEEIADKFKEIQTQSKAAMAEAMQQIIIGAFSQVVDLELLELPKGRR